MVHSWEVMIFLSIQIKDLGWDYWETCQSLKYLVAQRNLCLQGHSKEPTEGPKGSVSGKAEGAILFSLRVLKREYWPRDNILQKGNPVVRAVANQGYNL